MLASGLQNKPVIYWNEGLLKNKLGQPRANSVEPCTLVIFTINSEATGFLLLVDPTDLEHPRRNSLIALPDPCKPVSRNIF